MEFTVLPQPTRPASKLRPWGRRNFANAGPSSLGLILIRLLLTIDFTNLSAIYTIMTPRVLLALSIFFHAFAANAVAPR